MSTQDYPGIVNAGMVDDPPSERSQILRTEEQISACPFCGHDRAPLVKDVRELMPTAVGLEEDYVVVCSVLYPGGTGNAERAGCGATGGARHTPYEAIEAWNRRIS